ncbi:hypothetical protein CMI47_19370 [Candidatus Pacearchaeota archaeon]|nr:hypothetical protein [Candidatus Pacearchaeota archaeon]
MIERVGELCTIWDPALGSSPKYVQNWLIGIIVDERWSHEYRGMRYQVMWGDLKRDDTWYSWDDINPKWLPRDDLTHST